MGSFVPENVIYQLNYHNKSKIMDIEREKKEASGSDSDGVECDECSEGEAEVAVHETAENISIVSQKPSCEITKEDAVRSKPVKPKIKKKRKR